MMYSNEKQKGVIAPLTTKCRRSIVMCFVRRVGLFGVCYRMLIRNFGFNLHNVTYLGRYTRQIFGSQARGNEHGLVRADY